MIRTYLHAGIAVLLAVGGAPCLAQGASAPAPVAAPAPDPANLALAREIIIIAYPPESRQAMFARVSNAMITQMRDAVRPERGSSSDAELQKIFDRYVERVRLLSNESTRDGTPEIFEAFARAYARQFTHDELVQIKAFVSTPAGARYVQRASDLIADPDVAEANRAYMAQALRNLEPLIAELRRETEAYSSRQRRR